LPRRLLGALIGSLALVQVQLPASAAVDPDALVQAADRVRFPNEGFQVDVTIKTIERDGGEDHHGYRIVSKGPARTLVMTTSPASEKGQILLMRDQDLWVFMPKVSQPIRLPLSQKRTGQVSNGDLARANFSGDYKAKLLKTERIGGKRYHVLELIAARRGVTYHRVLYWVSASNSWPHKAEFYSVSKRLLKRAHYENFKELGGAIRPTRIVMEDTLKSGQRSIMEYGRMKMRNLPDKVFTKQYLKKLK
jgi:outer membrane lipoprotein-sorting protein